MCKRLFDSKAWMPTHIVVPPRFYSLMPVDDRATELINLCVVSILTVSAAAVQAAHPHLLPKIAQFSGLHPR